MEVTKRIDEKKQRRAKATKRIEKKQRRAETTTTIEFIPHDLIVEIVAQLVSHSVRPISDLKNLWMMCKMFRTAAKTKVVGQYISVEKEQSLHWWNKELYFDILRSCAAEDVFSLQRLSIGLCYLHKAMVGGHNATAQTMGLLLFGDHRTRQIGMELRNKIGASRTDDFETKIFLSTYAMRKEVIEAVRMLAMKKWPPRQREWCANPTCGVPRGWDQRRSFCSELCKRISENFQFYRVVMSNLLMSVVLSVFPWSQTT